MGIFPSLYELVTGRPWTTGRTASADFGRPPGAVYAEQLAAYADAELFGHGEAILADLQRSNVPAGTRG
jgi:hypothetical protein